MKILVCEHAGACHGVQRALEMAEDALSKGKPVYTLGSLIHNPLVVANLEARGIKVLEEIDEAKEGILVIRSHGVPPQVIDEALAQGLEVVDATCFNVQRVQEAVRLLRSNDYQVLIVGEAGHPEVESVRAHAGDGTLVAKTPEDLPDDLSVSTRIGVVAQTTQAPETLDAIIAELQRRGIEYDVRNTICSATRQRQRASAQLAHEVDGMIVIGGHNSGNTTRLYEICKAICPNTHHIESSNELDPAWFVGSYACDELDRDASDRDELDRDEAKCGGSSRDGSSRDRVAHSELSCGGLSREEAGTELTIGVTAGASTPYEQITRVVEALKSMDATNSL